MHTIIAWTGWLGKDLATTAVQTKNRLNDSMGCFGNKKVVPLLSTLEKLRFNFYTEYIEDKATVQI